MWDCGSPPGSAGRTSHEPAVQNTKWKFEENSPARLRQGGTLDAAEELRPCCRPGAGQCSCSHPTVSGQPWPGEGGWLHDTKGFISSRHSIRSGGPKCYTRPPRRSGTHLRCHCVPYQQRPSGQNVHFCPPCLSLPRGEAPAEGLPHLRQTQQHAVGSYGHSQRHPSQPVPSPLPD